MPPGLKVVNTDDVGILGSGTTGVSGTGIEGGTEGPGAGTGVSGKGSIGVSGQGDLVGVLGGGGSFPGVYGISQGIGVSGLGATGVHGTGTTAGVFGSSVSAVGVHGSGSTDGVLGESTSNSQTDAGVHGVGATVGVLGEAAPFADGGWCGVFGISDNWAVYSQGSCHVNGDLTVSGDKFALVKLANGEHRGLYCMESPECWFEDFGRARLVRGRARVRLDRTFAQVVRTGDYHVFLSPEGLSHGLYLARRSRNGFEVREQHQGKSTVPFSYRIVARRKDSEGTRFKRVDPQIPPKIARRAGVKAAAAPRLPDLPKSIRPPYLEAILGRIEKAKRSNRRRGRRRPR